MSPPRVVFTAIGLVTLLPAAHAGPRAVTLQQARAAIEHAPAHRLARSEITAAAAATRAAGAWPATTVGVSGTKSTARLGIVASLPLPIFGTLGAGRATARAELDIARAQATSADSDLLREVTAAWLALALAEARAEVSRQDATRQDSLAQIAQTRFEAGDAPQVDVVTARAGAARARADAEADADAVATASADLAALLGWDPTVILHAAGGIPLPSDVPSLESLRGRRTDNPRMRVATARVVAGNASVREVRAAHRPSLSLDLESLFDDPTLPGNDYRIGLTVELPLLGKSSAARAAAVARRHAAEVERDATMSAIDAALVAAYSRYRTSVRRLRTLTEDVLPAQRRAAELARTSYREGQSGLVTVVEAERALADAELQAIEARAGVATARSELEWAAGGAL